jgi:phosphatidylglycerophosphate synthase
VLGIGGALLVVALASGPLPVQIPVLMVAAVFIVAAMPSFAAVVADVLPPRYRGIGFALFTFLVTMSTALGPLVIGAISDLGGSLRVALAVGAAPCVPGAFVLRRARHLVAADMEAART